MKTTILLIVILILCTTLSVATASATEPEQPHPANAFWIEPAIVQLDASTTTVGYTFNITVWTNCSVQCGGWQIWLVYKRTHLNATTAGYTMPDGSKSVFFQDVTSVPVAPKLKPLNDTHNVVQYGEAWGGFGDFRAPGCGSLCWVEFNLTSLPTSHDLTILEFYGYADLPRWTYLIDGPTYEKVDVNVDQCSVEVTNPLPPSGTRIFVDPPEINVPRSPNSSEFSLNVSVAEISDLNACTFNLSYSPEIIGWIGMRLYEIQGTYPSPVVKADDEAGHICVELNLLTTLASHDPVAVIRLDFCMNASGAGLLDLHDTHLVDSLGREIEHVAVDGSFLSLIRDVAVVAVDVHMPWAYWGQSVHVVVTVENNGEIAETVSIETFFGTNMVNTTVADLQPNEVREVLVDWDTSAAVPYENYTLAVAIPAIPYEYDIANNALVDGQITVRIVGDVNGDTAVGIDDIYEIALSFGASASSSRWNEYADINQNGYVGIDDVYLAASNFGKSYP